MQNQEEFGREDLGLVVENWKPLGERPELRSFYSGLAKGPNNDIGAFLTHPSIR
jgi:hypothetical protein